MFSSELSAVQAGFSPASTEAVDTLPKRSIFPWFCSHYDHLITLEMLYFRKQPLSWGINLKPTFQSANGKKCFGYLHENVNALDFLDC